jgi:hypothetical protein
MIILPNYGESSQTKPTAMVDSGAAAAPGKAMQRIGDGLQDASDTALHIGKQIQSAHDDAESSTVMRKLSENQAAFNQSLVQDHDYQNYSNRLESEVLSPSRELITADMSPRLKAELTRRIEDWESGMRIKTGEASQMRSISRAKDELALMKNSYVENGDLKGYSEHVNQQGWMTPEEKKLEVANAEELATNRQAEMEIQRAPGQWLEKNAEAPGNPADFIRWKHRGDLARTELRKSTAAAMYDAENAMASGKLVTPEQVNSMYGDLRPSARESLKNEVIRRTDQQYRDNLRSPDVQAKVAGDVAGMIRDYKPNGEDFDAQYANISINIGNLNPGPLRDEFKGQLAAIRKGEEQVVDSNAKAAIKRIDDIFSEKKKRMVDSRKTAAAVDAGLLKDAGKLAAVGLTSEQVAILTVGVGDSTVEQLSASERMLKFREFYPLRNKDSKGVNTYDQQSFDAVAADEPTIHLNDADQAESLSKDHGRALKEMTEYLQHNPKAGDEQISGKLKSIGISISADSIRLKISPKRPVKEVDDTTSMIPAAMDGLKTAFNYYGKMYGVDPNFLAAISRLETGNGTSSAFRNKQNAMGVSNSDGPISFASREASIERMARVLANPSGPYRNATTLAEIAKIYAPPGAGNDPNGTNSYWPKGVGKYLKQAGIDPETQKLITRTS